MILAWNIHYRRDGVKEDWIKLYLKNYNDNKRKTAKSKLNYVPVSVIYLNVKFSKINSTNGMLKHSKSNW